MWIVSASIYRYYLIVNWQRDKLRRELMNHEVFKQSYTERFVLL